MEWHQYFTHEDNYFELLLGDLGYMGEERFIMRIPNSNLDAIQAYDKMHVRYQM
jgi:hypothetical protein